ncbi:uncharacterized protein [Nicotiana tomentosiformis]|uniref:uncharacterized protein n=1 Tax=Nicotiana tomentosiformis TaxID=4098 RepID=UPI00388C742B
MRFSELACHVVWLVPTYRERIRRFIDGLAYQFRLLLTRERVSGATFDVVVDIARQIEVVCSQERGEREAKRPRGSGGSGGLPSRGYSYHNRGRPYRHAQTGRPVHCGASSSHGLNSSHQGQSYLSALPAQSMPRAPSVQESSVLGSFGRYSCSRGPPQNSPPFFERDCYECGALGYVRK